MTFQLDPFQKEALHLIEKEHSLLVSAPTGAGKTLIAEAVIQKALRNNEHIIYTAPIKALSNQKFRDFQGLYGSEKVGILTGDVSINPNAPIVVMTTEIYRNSLFENSERIKKTGWVIFDEVHYLNDTERGTVWEESILFTPEKIRILALSATAPNIDQLAEWIRLVHKRPISVVKESHRPVPLHFFFQSQGTILKDIESLHKWGYNYRSNWNQSSREKRRGMRPIRAKANRLNDLIHEFINKDRFPVIYFTFGRKRTSFLAWESARFNFLNEKESCEILSVYDELLKRYDLEAEISANEMRPLIGQGIAYHHAGMLPTLKETIERLFTSRLIKLIFTTETFALGINMPARTVVFDELEKYYGDGFKYLTNRDFYQMAGRAGRRGMDDEGFVYCRVNPHNIPFPEVKRILYGEPEPVLSQLNTAYATLLNLYRNLGQNLFEFYPKSFYYFQYSKKRRKAGFQLLERKINLLEEMGYISGEGLTQKGEFATSLFGYELLLSEMHGDGILDELQEDELTVLLAGLIFEPRKGDRPPHLNNTHKKLLKTAQHYHKIIYKKESRLRITPHTKIPHFNLSEAVRAWTNGRDFEETSRLTGEDEGGLVRYFRMIIQLLRELSHAPHTSKTLKEKAQHACRLISRDVVDAEKQLRI